MLIWVGYFWKCVSIFVCSRMKLSYSFQWLMEYFLVLLCSLYLNCRLIDLALPLTWYLNDETMSYGYKEKCHSYQTPKCAVFSSLFASLLFIIGGSLRPKRGKKLDMHHLIEWFCYCIAYQSFFMIESIDSVLCNVLLLVYPSSAGVTIM